MLEHEGEEGDTLGDVVNVAFSIGDLGSHGVEEEREAEASTGNPDDGGYDAVSHGVSCDTGMHFLPPPSSGWGGVPDFCHAVAGECLR